MALKISEECTACGVCEPECPNQAISAGDPTYVIDAAKCNECEGTGHGPACADVCPVGACVKS